MKKQSSDEEEISPNSQKRQLSDEEVKQMMHKAREQAQEWKRQGYTE